MRFLFNLLNHSADGQRTLEDVVNILGQQLRALGHEAVWEVSNSQFVAGPGSYNIIVEGFTPDLIKVLAEHHARGARFVCLATEEPTERGFNHGREPEMVYRQRTFPGAAPYLSAIWHLVPGESTAAWYRRHAPTSYVELGHAPALVRPADRAEPEFDFGFFGTLSQRRLRVLKRLAKRSGGARAVHLVTTFPPQAERDREMRRCKVIVQIRKHEEMGLVSSSRCNTALHLGRPVVAEPHLLAKPWDSVVTFAETVDAFYDLALMTKAAWRGAHARQMENFRSLLTPQFCVGRAIEETGL